MPRRLGLVMSIAAVAGLTACERRETATPAAPEPAAAPAPTQAAAGESVRFACNGGVFVHVRQPSRDSVVVTHRGESFTLTAAPADEGARFVGQNREWRVRPAPAGQGGVEATLSLLQPDQTPPVRTLARCWRGGNGEDAGTTQAAAAEDTPAARACTGGQLTLAREARRGAGVDERAATYAFTNLGRHDCALRGFPYLAFFDARDRRIDQVEVVQSQARALGGGAPTEVVLPPDGRAVFHVLSEDGGECVTAERLQAGAPGARQLLEIDDRLRLCGRQVRVSPVRAETR